MVQECLKRNHGCYRGEEIDLNAVLSECVSIAHEFDFEIQHIPVIDDLSILALKKVISSTGQNIYISAGIHGDEPAGPVAIAKLLKENVWPKDANLWIFPCLNPKGFEMKCRCNAHDLDLNRDYNHLVALETKAHVAWLESEPHFNLSFCLHEDWEAEGFYLYETKSNSEISRAQKIIGEVEKIMPIDTSTTIDGHKAHNGIIDIYECAFEDECWPEAIYLSKKKNCHNYTLETSSDFDLEDRVEAMVKAVRVGLEI